MLTRNLSRPRGAIIAIAGTMLLAGGAVAPAHAQDVAADEEQLPETVYDCPLNEASEEYMTLLIRDLTSEEDDEVSEKVSDFASADVLTCVERHDVPEEDVEGYAAYAFAAVAEALGAEVLSVSGFDVDAIDALFDVGEGRTNTGVGEFDEARVQTILESAYSGEVAPAEIPEQIWTMLGIYVESTAMVNRYVAQ